MKNKSPVFLIAFLFLCFATMLGASLYNRFVHPDLVVSRMGDSSARPRDEATEIMNAIGSLMQTVARNPKDKEALLRLTENLMAMGQWQTAENFAQKALALDKDGKNDDGRALYLMALIHHNLGRNDQAAETLEKMLEKYENPSARYSLGILYAHFLNRRDDAIKEFQKGIENKQVAPALKEALTRELERLSRDNPASTEEGNGQATGYDAER